MSVTVEHAPEQQRWEAALDGDHAGHLEYTRAPDLVVITHTEVDRSFEGRGVGGALARAALDGARAEGVKVLPVCPFVRGWMDRHPDYENLEYRSGTRPDLVD